MERIDVIDLSREGIKLLELGLIVFQLGLALVELFEVSVNLTVPQPGELLEALLELDDLVTGSLDGTGKEKDNLDNFLVAGNPGVEWFPLILGQVFLVPVLHFLGTLEHRRRSLVNRPLHFGE